MDIEEAKRRFKEARDKRERYVRGELEKESDFWEHKSKEDSHYIEKLLIRKILEAVHKNLISSEKFNVQISLENTMYSGDLFINRQQLMDVIGTSGFELIIKRSCDATSILLSVYIERSKLVDSQDKTESLSFLDNKKIEELIETKEQDWLSRCIKSYLNYLTSEKGCKETEKRFAKTYFDDLMDKWNSHILNGGVTTPYYNSPIYTDPIHDYEETKSFYNVNNIVAMLCSWLNEVGFEVEVENDENAKYTSYRVGVSAKDYVIDKPIQIEKKKKKKK